MVPWSPRAIPAFFLLASAVEAAPDSTYRLDWQAGERLDCTDEQRFAESVESQLGQPVFNAEAASSIVVQVAAEGGNWALRLSLTDEAGAPVAERRVVSAVGDCQGLVASAALTLEVLLGQDQSEAPATNREAPAANREAPASNETANASSLEPQSSAFVDTAPEDEPSPVDDVDASASTSSAEMPPSGAPAAALLSEAPAVAPAPSADVAVDEGGPTPALGTEGSPARFELGAEGLFYANVLPERAFGVGVSAAYEVVPRGWVEVGGALSQPVTTTTLVETRAVETTLALTHAHLAAGWAAVDDGRLRLLLAGRASIGQMSTDIVGAREIAGGGVLWSALGAGASVGYRLRGPLIAAVASHLIIPLSSREFGVSDGPLLTTLPPLGALVLVKVGAQL